MLESLGRAEGRRSSKGRGSAMHSSGGTAIHRGARRAQGPALSGGQANAASPACVCWRAAFRLTAAALTWLRNVQSERARASAAALRAASLSMCMSRGEPEKPARR